MAISQAVCNSFRGEVLQGIHSFGAAADVFKIALYTSAANIGATTTAYTTAGEVAGPGYVAGGSVLTGQSLTVSGATAYVDFNDVVWTLSTITARGALIYNSSKANRSVAVIDFGSDRSSSTSSFTVSFPSPSVTEAIIRIS